MKIMEVNRISASICHSYERNDSELTENIQELSISNDFYVMMESGGRVLLFMPESDSILPVYQYKDQLPKLKAMLDASKSNSGCVSYKINSGVENYSTLAYARYLRKAPGNEVYLYIFSPLYPVSSTVDILKNQLFYVTIITLFGAFSLAIYFANRISRPIKSITTTAKEMGRGNYDVKFRGNSYSEINNLAETLNTAAYELGNADARQKDLIANVSHDLKTPLTMIRSYCNSQCIDSCLLYKFNCICRIRIPYFILRNSDAVLCTADRSKLCLNTYAVFLSICNNSLCTKDILL